MTKIGNDILILYNYTEILATTSARDFIKNCVARTLWIKRLWCNLVGTES